MRPINLNNESFDEQIFDAELSTLELPDHDPTAIRFIVTSADGTAAELEYPPSL